ncbi:deoxyguanosinetriphosphate triphosphohydrolase [Actinomycetaceae bacterium TAE3-ERU4]|nr:deoxyguanosinetriphosphate triphosphohydrolase [Actinomycetaceae bacterium TAE3-ERU4]
MSMFEYSHEDMARMVEEPEKSVKFREHRTPFERDRARVLHSSALRRLGAKTQVLGPSSDDFIRTRLTHSLEVAQVGRELGRLLGANPDIVDAACLSHDLGHPPFGHNGERALAEVAKGYGGFEGNAQTLRILTRLEPKVVDKEGKPAGLNLARATLDACVKYPWGHGECPKGSHKFGFYEDDLPIFTWVRQGASEGIKSLEAQIMDLSDDIGYSVHDVEDAITLGRLDPNPRAWDDVLREQLFAATRDWYGADFSDDRLEGALSRLTSASWWPTSYDGSYASLARLKDMSSHLIGRFIDASVKQTRAIWGPYPLGRYVARVEVPEETLEEIVALKGLAAYFVMIPREHEPVYLQQRTLLYDLAAALLELGPTRLEPIYAQYWREHNNDEGKVRAVVDQIASLTDTSASQWHASLCGLLSTQL